MYRFDIKAVADEVQRRGAQRVILQLPDGLRPHGFELARELEELSGAQVIISADPCYGACDLALDDLKRLGAQLIVHCGHAEIPPLATPHVIYAEGRDDVDVEGVIRKAAELLQKERRIGLAATVQHLGRIREAKKLLEGFGKEVQVGSSSGWLRYDGQVLGCSYNSTTSIAEAVDAFVVIAGGNFHAIGVCLSSGKRTIVADPYLGEARDISKMAEGIARRRYASITKFKDASKVAIIVSTKSGQFNLNAALNIKRKLEGAGKGCAIVALAEVRPEYLMSFSDIEAFVNTACPRVATDDQDRFTKPILNPNEALVALGELDFEACLKSYVG